jgi:siroheme synthase (precorrin-2 oxidase/ferrochelatase)
MGPSAATFMRSTAAPKVENETPRFLVKSDSAFLRTRAAISELQISELRDTQERESERSRKWIMMSESKFRHKNFHQTHALKTRSFIRCNRFAAPVFCFFWFCFWVYLSLEDAVAHLHATYRILETIQACTNRRSPIQ